MKDVDAKKEYMCLTELSRITHPLRNIHKEIQRVDRGQAKWKKIDTISHPMLGIVAIYERTRR